MTTVKVDVHTKKTYVIELNGGDLLQFLTTPSVILDPEGNPLKIPTHAEVTVEVPSGADWSGMALDLRVDASITISWEEHS